MNYMDIEKWNMRVLFLIILFAFAADSGEREWYLQKMDS